MLKPSWYANPRMQHQNFEKKIKNLFGCITNTMGHFGTHMTFRMSPKTVEKQLQ
jgi:hypothetical protein